MFFGEQCGKLKKGNTDHEKNIQVKFSQKEFKYSLGFRIGKGCDGETRVATKGKGKTYCAKIIPLPKGDAEKRERTEREVEALRRVRGHRNVVHFEEAFLVFQHGMEYAVLVMELFGKQDLFQLFREGFYFKEKYLSKIISQLVDALIFCHKERVVHRDVKLQNVLIEPLSFHVKLIDFGLSAVCETDEEMSELDRLCGSPFYVPPEVYNGHYDGRKSDVWSLGVLLYALTANKFPFDNTKKDLSKLRESVQNDPFEIPICSAYLANLLEEMLEKNPNKRISLEEIKSHDWIQTKNSPKKSVKHLKTKHHSLNF